jgi:hypothetical protein
MAIVSSEITEQIDLGDKWQVLERHTDSLGAVHEWRYHPGKSVDVNAKLAEHAAQLASALAEQEIDEILNG